MISTKRSLMVAALVVSFSGVAQLHAQDDEAVIGYRQKLMVGIRASVGSIGDIMKFKLPVGNAHVAAHAKNISEYAKLIPAAFEKKITAGKTDAKPEAWANWDDFTAKANVLSEAAAKLSTAASGGDMKVIMPALKGVTDACGGCHNDYRKPEEERFPRD